MQEQLAFTKHVLKHGMYVRLLVGLYVYETERYSVFGPTYCASYRCVHMLCSYYGMLGSVAHGTNTVALIDKCSKHRRIVLFVASFAFAQL